MIPNGMREALRDMHAAKDKMQAAASKALNRVGQGVVTEATRKLRETYNVKAADIKAATRVVLSRPEDGQVLIKAKGRNLPLTQFKVTPKSPPPRRPKAVKVAVKKNGGKKLKTAFLALRRGRVGVMKRQHPAGQSGRARRLNPKGDRPELPIEELFGPAIPVMLGEPQVVEHIQDEAERRMSARLDHEISRILR